LRRADGRGVQDVAAHHGPRAPARQDGDRVAPELVQEEATPEGVWREGARLLDSPEISANMRRRWAEIREKLGPREAAARAAQAVLEVLPA
jgi:lipid A disaccharide synthetase